jgi:hypothetical protein
MFSKKRQLDPISMMRVKCVNARNGALRSLRSQEGINTATNCSKLCRFFESTGEGASVSPVDG